MRLHGVVLSGKQVAEAWARMLAAEHGAGEDAGGDGGNALQLPLTDGEVETLLRKYGRPKGAHETTWGSDEEAEVAGVRSQSLVGGSVGSR